MFKRIYIEITNICNLNCSFCKGTSRPKQHMPVESFKKVLDKIQGYGEYIYLHVLGEPLMHPNLDAILDLAYQYKLKVNITTNGHLLEKKIALINNAKSIRQLNISIHSYDNVDEVSKLLDTVDSINNDCYISLRLWDMGDESKNEKIVDLINNHYQIKIDQSINKSKINDRLFLSFEPKFKWPDIKDNECHTKGTCRGLRDQIGILVDGTVVPCCLDTDGIIKLGNIFEDDMYDIVNSNKFKEIKEGFLNRKLVESLCRRCQYIQKFNKQKKVK